MTGLPERSVLRRKIIELTQACCLYEEHIGTYNHVRDAWKEVEMLLDEIYGKEVGRATTSHGDIQHPIGDPCAECDAPDCPGGCHYQPPYGWVIMAGCAIHDTDECPLCGRTDAHVHEIP